MSSLNPAEPDALDSTRDERNCTEARENRKRPIHDVDAESDTTHETVEEEEPMLPVKKRVRADDVDPDIIPNAGTYVNNLALLFQLNKTEGGLTEAQLSTVLCRCRSCEKVFTKYVYYTYHSFECPPSQ